MIEIINPYTVKIIIACRQQDSIRSIAQRINVSYGWTYKWVQELAKKGAVRLTKMKIYLNEKNEFYRQTIRYIRHTLGNYVSFHYEILSILGIRHCFTQTDAVYIWTKGGYNISRYRDYYPIFIKVHRADQRIFKWYAQKLGLCLDKKTGIFYQAQYVDSIEAEYCEGVPVDPLDATIDFMSKHIYNFMPALEMIKEMYGKKIPIKYQEAVTNV